MLIKKVSMLSGKMHEIELPITVEEIQRWKNGELAQRVWPHLTPAQREFIITGSTDEEWNAMKDDEDIDE
jgi:hypothetical protein